MALVRRRQAIAFARLLVRAAHRRFDEQVLMIEYRPKDLEVTCETFGATHALVLRDRNLSRDGVREWC